VTFEAEVRVMLKPGVNDPQGLSIRGGLHALGFGEVSSVRAGKVIVLELEAADEAQAQARLKAMCEQLLANPVIEQYSLAIAPARAGLPGRWAE
jgi:phosphoribosylformylglycinamidine synthase subunit PurS